MNFLNVAVLMATAVLPWAILHLWGRSVKARNEIAELKTALTVYASSLATVQLELDVLKLRVAGVIADGRRKDGDAARRIC